MDELSQLDELIESDILEALGQDIPTNIQKDNSALNKEEITPEDLNELEDKVTLDEEEITLEDLDEQIGTSPEINIQEQEMLSSDTVQKIDSNINTNDLGTLLSQLLTNKTIEITIKIKD